LIGLTEASATPRGYRGAASLHKKVYFVPLDHSKVGVLDTSSNTFSEIEATGVTEKFAFRGAAVVGNSVYFSPLNEAKTSVIATAEAVAVNNRVYFVPADEANVGVLGT
jgi:hypothetical protein